MSPTDPTSPEAAPRPWLHRFAIIAACATFPLVLVGGLVTTYDVGLAVPDAPTTFGHNTLFYSWSDWLHAPWGVFLEHGHRLFAELVGLLTLVLAAGLWTGSPRGWVPWLAAIVIAGGVARGAFGSYGLLLVGGVTTAVAGLLWARDTGSWRRWLGITAVGVVLMQGGFGALRVVLNDRGLAALHGVTAQAFFALMVCLARVTSRGWIAPPAKQLADDAGRLQRLAFITTSFVVLQLVFGALLRHLGLVWALVAHGVVALIIVVHVGLLAKRVFLRHAELPPLVRAVEILAVLTLGQLMLGTGAWATNSGFGPYHTASATGVEAFFRTAHVTVGALVLATSVVLTLDCYQLLARPAVATRAGAPRAARARGAAPGTPPSLSSLERREMLMGGQTA